MKILVCHTPMYNGQNSILTIGNEYPVIREDEEDLVIKNDEGSEHYFGRTKDEEGESYRDWFHHKENEIEPVRWTDFFGEEHLFLEGKGDDIFHVIPNKYDEDGNSFTEILSKRAILELANQINNS